MFRKVEVEEAKLVLNLNTVTTTKKAQFAAVKGRVLHSY